MENRFNRVVSSLWVGLFAIFAALQINDPDPLVWISIYLVVALLNLVNIWRRLPQWLPILGIAISLIFCFLLWPDEYEGLTNKMDSVPAVELARESLGLLICALSYTYLLLRALARRPAEDA
jgi:hypothetical protein